MGETSNNQFPFRRHHFNHLAQVHGQDIADQILYMHQHQLRNGGINPAAIETVFPNGPAGEIDEEMLIKGVLPNFYAWHQQGGSGIIEP